MIDHRIGDHVGVIDYADEHMFGKIESGHAGEWMIRTADGELTGPWSDADTTAHAAYPHEPGTLYDCPVCEAMGTLDPN